MQYFSNMKFYFSMKIQNMTKYIEERSKSLNLITRPNASSGLWLCFLLPLAYLVTNIRNPFSSKTFEYKMTTLASYGLCFQSLNFFLYLIIGGRRLFRIFLAFLPGCVTAEMFYLYLKQKPSVCIFWGLSYTIFYQYVFIKAIRKLPKSFTLGEATIVGQGFTLFFFTAILQLPYLIVKPPIDDLNKMNSIFLEGLFFLLIFVWLISSIYILRKTFLFYLILFILILIIFCFPVTPDLPILEVTHFIISDLRRVFMIIFYVGVLGLSAVAIGWQISKSQKVTSSVRKIFHILLVIVYIPGLLYQCTLLYLSTGVALCGIILLELMRVIEIYPFSNILKQSFNVFADEKDVGNVALTPFYLLVGCSLPLWISPCTCGVDNNFTAPNNFLVLLSGVLTVGIGDSAASIFGSNLGKHKLYCNAITNLLVQLYPIIFLGSEKSYEGLVANIIFQSLTVVQLYSLNLITLNSIQTVLIFVLISLVSLLEAYTDQVDNIVLPIVFYILANLI